MVLLPEGSEVTLAELREIAARQQQQIEAQQQLLVAKEQRLKFLKQQEARHHQGAQTTEGERVRPLRDKVETQELKLRRLRALRGQAEQQRASNHNLSAELDSIRALFNEKEKELSLAVAKVEELTRQLEELRRGNVNGLLSDGGSNLSNSPSVVELEKLRRELLYRTKLNEQQNARILQQRETLAKRQEEISLMDQRIASLQQRLHRKRTLNQQIASHIHAATLAKQAQIHPLGSHAKLVDNQGKAAPATRLIRPLNTNIAAVEPLKRVPQENENCLEEVSSTLKGDDDLAEFALNKKDPKYQTLPYNTKFSVKSSRDGTGEDMVDKSQPPHLVIDSEITSKEEQHLDNPSINSTFQKPHFNYNGGNSNQPVVNSKIPGPHTLNNLAPRPFGTSYSGSSLIGSTAIKSSLANQSSVSSSAGNAQSTNLPNTSSMVTSPVMSKHSVLSPQMSNGIMSRSKLPSSTSIPVLPATALTSVLKKSGSNNVHVNPAYKIDIPPYTSPPPGNIRSPSVTSSNSQSNSLESQSSSNTSLPKASPNQQEAQTSSDGLDSLSDSTSSGENLDKSKPALPPKPSVPVKPVPPPRQTHVLGVASPNGSNKSDVDSALMVLKGTGNRPNTRNGNGYRYVMKQPTHNFPSRLPLGPATMDQYAKAINHVYRNEIQNQQLSESLLAAENEPNANDLTVDSEGNRKLGSTQLPIQPRPLTIKKPSGLDPPRLRSTLSGSLSQMKRQGDVTSPTLVTSPTGMTNRRIEMPPAFLFPENQNGESHSPNKTTIGERIDVDGEAVSERNSTVNHSSVGSVRSKNAIKFQSELLVKDQSSASERINENHDSEQVLESIHSNSEQGTEDENDNEHKKHLLSDSTNETSQDDIETDESQVSSSTTSNRNSSAVYRRVKKGNLKTKGSAKNPRRVSFDPLALLLDASLEGELELVRKTAKEVTNPSAANDEGITALHNAICAGHLEIVKFLVEFGCDVNAQDSDGWTPLHCAASCNNLPMVKFLVEHGACLFAKTLSDRESPAEKCEEEDEGFDGCSEYLYSVQEKLGILNGGAVYGVYDYEAQNPDELSFKDGEMVIVLRKGDDLEREWWWSKLKDREGYIPRNLLGLHPRVTARRDP